MMLSWERFRQTRRRDWALPRPFTPGPVSNKDRTEQIQTAETGNMTTWEETYTSVKTNTKEKIKWMNSNSPIPAHQKKSSWKIQFALWKKWMNIKFPTPREPSRNQQSPQRSSIRV